jgi:enoyl-[acyl-carrier protein] reductase/trans-2-enoyl-CoA reductase (NAD+)
MGGADWARWVHHLADRRLLAEGFTTAALTYIGSPTTEAVYRRGTIGAAKTDLEATARTLNERLGGIAGRAVTSVNGAAVTQSSTAVPTIALYTALLHAVLGDAMVPPIGQLVQLWDQFTSGRPLTLDDEGRLRLDTWELAPPVQAALISRWNEATTSNISRLADLEWFRAQVHQLYGFAVPGISYDVPVETDVPWPDPVDPPS